MAKQRLVKKGSQYGILDEASNTVLPISENMKLVQKQGQYGILDGDSVIPIDNFSESITDSDLDILKKKNSTESVGQPAPKPTSSVSPKIQGSGLVASPAKAGKEEVGVIDDLWNSFKGAGAKALASIASVPQFAQNAAIDIMSSVTGRSSDFNKLPSNVKKQVRDAIAGSLSAATPTGRFAQASQEATDYLNKKSEDIYKKTRQEEVDVIDELAKFGENPNAESIQKILYQGLKTTVESIPYMAIGAVSLPAMGATAAAAKRAEDVAKEGDVGIGQLLNAGITGASEAVFEGTTQKILGKAAKAALGNPAASKAVAEGFVKSIFKDFGQEGASEGATTLIQELSDKITKGEDINFWDLAKKVGNSAILGGLSGGGISATGAGVGAARRYVAGKIMPKEQIEKIDNNIKTIQSLNLEHGEDVDPRVNEIVNKKIDELLAENEAIVSENEKIAENLSADQVKQIFDIDDKLEENFNSAKSVIDDAAMDKSAKELLLDDLLKQQNNLKQQKDAIQKQATSEIPVQPEAGISGEVAKGEPQTEPQVPTEEVKVEEVISEPLINVKNTTAALQNIAKKTPEKVEKILGEDIVYHGTKEDFNEFDENKMGTTDAGWYGKGFYFHSDRDRGGYGDVVKAAKIDLKNPIVLPVENSGQYLYDIIGKEAGLDESFRDQGSQNIIREIGSDNFTKIAKKLGYDGVIVEYAQGTKEIVAFDKSSINQSNPKTISEAYHKAKKDGSNPELVQAVESLLSKTQEVKVEEITTPSETIEVFHGGNLPSLEEGKPLYVSEDASQANEYAKMSDGNVSKFLLDENKIANEEDAYAVMEDLGLRTDANFFELIDPRFDEALSEEEIKSVYDALKGKGFEAVRYTDINQKTLKPDIKNILVIDASKSLKTEQTTTPEVKEEVVVTPEQKAEQVTAVKKGIDAVNKAVERGRPLKKAVEGGIAFMQKTIAYEQADDVTREQMLRDINKKFGVKEKKAPSVKKVMGETTQKKVTVNEMTALKDQIKLESKAAKGAEKATDQIRKDVAEKVKSFITRGGLSKAQQKSLLNSLAKTNILNPVMRERLFERMQKMFKRADYQDRIKEATTFRNRIKKLAKSNTLQASVANMARDFGKVIPEFTDIDQYLEKAREVYGAIKKPIRVAALIEDINAFTKAELKKQEEKLKNTLLDQYDYLAEAGLIDESMSLAQIQQYIMDVESGTKPDAAVNEAKIRENLGELFDSMSDIVDSIVNEEYNPLTGEEVELDNYTKNLINNFTSMDLNDMSVRDSYRAVEALENFLVNGIVDNMETMYKTYEGAEKATGLANQGIVAESFRRVFGGKGMNFLSQAWTSAFSPVKSTLDLVHRSRAVGSKVFDAMGLRDLSNQSSRAKTEANNIDKAYNEKFSKTKPNNKSFNDVENVFERGIYAHLRRNVVGTAEEMKAEFDRRKNQIVESIDALLKSQDDKLVKRGKILSSIFENIKDAQDISQVESYIDPINQDAVKWWNTIFDKYYPEVKQIAASVYNTILEDDINYSPDNYEKIVEDKSKDVDEPSSYRMGFDFLNQSKSGTLMKNNRIKGIPQNRVVSFDFDYNNSSAFHKMLTDVRTAPSVQQYRGFVQSPAFEKIYPNVRERNVIQNKLNYYVNEVRSKNVATGSVNEKAFAKVIQAVSRYGTSRALGGALSGLKQASTALVNTAVSLMNDPKSFGKGVSLLTNKDAMDFLNNSGYGIANRGLESQTAIESANKIIEQTDVNSANKVAETVTKAGKIYLEYSLKNGDVLGARASWMAYYVHKLKQLGYNTDNIDWKNHKLVKEAGDYAEDQINLQQNVSDAAMMGKFLTTKNPYATIARSMVIPFSSFIFNAKDKITTDVTILTSKNSNKQDKIDALKSLTATGAEMVAFEAMSAGISSGIVIAANSILGIDEDEDEKEKRRNQYINSAFTRFTTDVLSPMPNIGDKAVVGIVNGLLDLAQSDLDEEDKFKLFSYKPESELDAMLNLIGGIPEVATKPFINMGDTIYKISSDSYIDKYGNEIELSNEDKQKLGLVLAVELLGATNILPSEVVRLNEKVKQTIEKEAR